MPELVPMQIIARIHTDFTEKFGIPRQSGLVENPGVIVFEPPYRQPGCAARVGGLFPYLAVVAVFPRRTGRMVAYGPSAPFGRQYAYGRVCNTLPVSSQCHRAFFRAPDGDRTFWAAGAGVVCQRSRSARWNADFRYQTVFGRTRIPTLKRQAGLLFRKKKARSTSFFRRNGWSVCQRRDAKPCALCWRRIRALLISTNLIVCIKWLLPA